MRLANSDINDSRAKSLGMPLSSTLYCILFSLPNLQLSFILLAMALHSPSSIATSPDRIASLIISTFNSLPQKSKPRLPTAGRAEWVTVAGIVMEHDSKLTCASVSTGVKCLPATKIPLAEGLVLQDSHAEVLAIRAFNAFLLQECRKLLTSTSTKNASQFVRFRAPEEISRAAPQPFIIKDSVKIHMFTSEAPCGDASMELTMSSQADPTPWSTPDSMSNTAPATELNTPSTLIRPSNIPNPTSPSILRGRGYFSHLGHLRTKPGRADSPPTLSKSCSDKLTARQYLSLLLTPTSYFIAPSLTAYIKTLVLPEKEYSAVGCERAFTLRLDPLQEKTDGDTCSDSTVGGYIFRPFEVHTTSAECISNFPFSRRNVMALAESAEQDYTPVEVIPSNISSIMFYDALADEPSSYHAETLITGVLQGRKAFSGKGASRVSKMELWRGWREVAQKMSDEAKENQQLELVRELMEWFRGRRVYEELKMGSHCFNSDHSSLIVGEKDGIQAKLIDSTVGEEVRRIRWDAKLKLRLILSPWTRNGGNEFSWERVHSQTSFDNELGSVRVRG